MSPNESFYMIVLKEYIRTCLPNFFIQVYQNKRWLFVSYNLFTYRS